MDCAGCGSCCEVVWTQFDPTRLAEMVANTDRRRRDGAALVAADIDVDFYAAHFRPLRPDEAGDGSVGADAAAEHGLTPWACDAFDRESRLCTAHETRPSMCSGYPWYLGWPWGNTEPDHERAFLPDRCSHRWDVPVEHRGELVGRLLPLWPV